MKSANIYKSITFTFIWNNIYIRNIGYEKTTYGLRFTREENTQEQNTAKKDFWAKCLSIRQSENEKR